ncbi:MAG: hypothetical protein AAGF57_20520 [Pseudomonadota bacterium]
MTKSDIRHSPCAEGLEARPEQISFASIDLQATPRDALAVVCAKGADVALVTSRPGSKQAPDVVDLLGPSRLAALVQLDAVLS